MESITTHEQEFLEFEIFLPGCETPVMFSKGLKEVPG